MIFDSTFSDEPHSNMKTVYSSRHDFVNFHRKNELEALLQQIKAWLTKDVTLTFFT